MNRTVAGAVLLMALVALTGCEEPDPAKNVHANCTTLTFAFYVCDVPMPDGRTISCVSKSGSGGALSCDWSPQ